VALDVLVVPNGDIVLEIGAVILVQRDLVFDGKEFLAPGFEEEARQVEIPRVAGDAPELDQGQLDFRVARVARPFGRRAENRVNVVRKPGGDIQEGGSAGGLVVRDGRFEQVPGAIEFVPVAQVRPSPAGVLDDEMAVEVAVGLLRGGEQADDVLQLPFERGVGVGGERVGHRFQRFVEVRVHEHRAAVAVGRAPGGQPDVFEVARLFEFLEAEGDADQPVRFTPRRPERVLEGDLCERHRLEFEQPGFVSGGPGSGQERSGQEHRQPTPKRPKRPGQAGEREPGAAGERVVPPPPGYPPGAPLGERRDFHFRGSWSAPG